MIVTSFKPAAQFGQGAFRPHALGAIQTGGPLRRGRGGLAQNSPWVDIRPNVNVNPNIDVKAPISIELGALPLSLGLFAGAGVALLLRSGLSEGWPQDAAMVAGAGLALGGIVNLFLKKPAAPAPGPVPGPVSTNPQVTSPVVPAPPSAAGQSVVTSSYAPPSDEAVTQVSGHISYPGEGDTISLYPWQSSYTVRVELSNPTPNPVTMEVVCEAMEDPSSDASKEKTYSNAVQVTVPPNGQVTTVDVPMSSQAWGFFVPYVDVVVNAKKRAWGGAPAYMIDARSFVIK